MKKCGTILFLLFIVCGGAVNCFAQITEDEALSKFVSAGIAYQDENYDAAIARYREILDGGRESGAVYYNLGNSYFRKGDSGRAILNYERAKRLIPRDSDLNFNYHYVRASMPKYGEEGFLNRAADNFMQFYTVEDMIKIVTGSVFAIGFIFLLFLYLGWPQPIRRGIIALLVFILTVYSAGLIAKVQKNENSAIVVKAGESYFEPRADSTAHFKLFEGMEAKILRSEGAWVKIQRVDGKVGWISWDVIERI